MEVALQKGLLLRLFVHNDLSDCKFKSDVFEYKSDLFFEYENNSDFKSIHYLLQLTFLEKKSKGEVISNQQPIKLNIFDVIYEKIFIFFLKHCGSLDDWMQTFLIVEMQVLDLNGNIVCESDGFESFSSMEY